jgi:hypothetical protein
VTYLVVRREIHGMSGIQGEAGRLIARSACLVRDDLNWRCSMSDDSKLVDPMTFDRPARFS